MSATEVLFEFPKPNPNLVAQPWQRRGIQFCYKSYVVNDTLDVVKTQGLEQDACFGPWVIAIHFDCVCHFISSNQGTQIRDNLLT